LNLDDFLWGQFAHSGLDHQTNFASPRNWRSLRACIAAFALGAVVLLAGCQDFNPYLGAASQNSSTIFYVTPSSRPAGCSGFTLDIQGSGFVNGTVVNWNNSPRATDFESSTELLATINASDVAAQTAVSIVATTPPLTGQQNQGNNLSNFVTFNIQPPIGQAGTCPAPPTFPPTITALSVPSATVGTTIQIAGNYFGGLQNASTVTFNTTTPTVTSTPATPASWSGTLLTLPVPAVPIPTGVTSVSASVVITVQGVASTPLSPGANAFTVLASGSGSSLVSRQSSSLAANATWSFSGTANPRYAALVAPSANLSVAGTGLDKIYLRDTCQGGPAGCSPTTTLVSVAFDGSDPDGASRSPSVSASGRFVAFASDASNLVPGDANGVADIFLRDTCVGAPRGCTPTTTRLSVGPDGVESNGASAWPSITPDGRFVAFDSAATNLVPDGQANATGISGGAFLWDTCFGVPSASGCTPNLTRLSVPSVAPHSH
jgi:IPT/TIG domain-containing protein/WD40 repeat protein